MTGWRATCWRSSRMSCPRMAGPFRTEEACSFLKKRTKKLLDFGVPGLAGVPTKEQKSFGSFLQKRTPFLTRPRMGRRGRLCDRTAPEPVAHSGAMPGCNTGTDPCTPSGFSPSGPLFLSPASWSGRACPRLATGTAPIIHQALAASRTRFPGRPTRFATRMNCARAWIMRIELAVLEGFCFDI